MVIKLIMNLLQSLFLQHAIRIFLIDTLNFSFWPRNNAQSGKEEYFQVEWPTGTFHTGYWSLCAALQRAIEGPDALPLLDAEFLANIDLPTVEKIFRSSNGVVCPLLEERMAVLREAGSVLVKHFDGKVENMIRSANHSALAFIELVTKHFTSYQDQAEFHGKTVFIWKVSVAFSSRYKRILMTHSSSESSNSCSRYLGMF